MREQLFDMQFLRSLIDRISPRVAVLSVGDEGSGLKYVYVNPSYQAMKPHTPMTGRTLLEVWPEGVESLMPGLRHVLKTGEPWVINDLPVEVEDEQGAVSLHRFTGEVTRAKADGVSYLLIAFTDMSTPVEEQLRSALELRTRLMEKVQAEHGIVRAIMENTGAHLAYLDPDFRFVAVNSTYIRSSGYTEGELLGQDHFALFPDAENEAIFKHVRDTGEVAEYHARPFEFPDQPWRGITYWDWRLTPIKDQDAQTQGVVLSLLDVTQAVRAKRYSDALNHLHEVLHTTMSSELLVSKVLPELVSAIECEVGAIVLRLEASRWRLVDSVGLPESLRHGELTSDDLPASSEALETGRIVFVEHAEECCIAGTPPGTLGVCSLLVVPMSPHDRRLGVITFGFVSGPGTFDDAQIEFAEEAAVALSLALENARLYESESVGRHFAEALNKINQAVHSTLDIDEIMQRAVTEATKAAGFDASAIHLKEHEHWRLAYSYGLPDMLREHRSAHDKVPLSEAVLERGEPLMLEDAQSDERVNCELAARLGVRAMLALPLVVRDDPIGVLYSGSFDGKARFVTQVVDFMSSVAGTLSLALENARLYQNEHRIADRLQAALLTLPESVPGIEFAHGYHTATEADRIGGDFYDVCQLSHDHIGVVIGDVAGKGLDAAVITSLVKNTIRAHANERGKTPSKILALTNEVVFRETGRDSFVTVFLGILDCRDGRLVYSSAGHTTAAVLRGGGEVDELPVTGPLLGAFLDVEFDHAETSLGFEELLFLYTDGLTDARSGAEHYGEKRLFDFLASMPRQCARDVVDAVTHEVTSFSGGHLSDDMAILALKRAEHGLTGPWQQKLDL